MKALILAILILYASPIIGQRESDDLVSKALQFYIMDRNYDSALVYFQHPDFDSTYHRYLWRANIGDCYVKLGQLEEAKEVLLQCIKDTIEIPIRPLQRRCCHVFAELYLANSQPDSALFYLKLADKKWPYVRLCQNEAWVHRRALAYLFAKCHRGLGQLDSAISCLTPHAFSDPYQMFVGEISNEENEIVNYYFEILVERYDQKSLKQELKQGIDRMIYQEGVQKGIRGDLLDYQFYHEACFFEWFGDTVILHSSYSPIRPHKEKPQKRYSKELGVQELKQTLIYRKLMEN